MPSAAKPEDVVSSLVRWSEADVTVGMDRAGSGRTLLLLPALSSISTRGEMRPLLERLSSSFRVTSIDWPGFGDRARPRVDWTPDMLSRFLAWILREVEPEVDTIVAAGHAATYAAHQTAQVPRCCNQLVFVAPTWRGPLPTMAGGHRPWFDRIVSALDSPMAGPLLYRANVSGPVLNMMAREHVYQDAGFLDVDRLRAKRAVTRAPGARHASARFVTGRLDRVTSRTAFVDFVRAAGKPTLVLVGAGTPPKSLAEMDALDGLANVDLVRLPKGRLALGEEFPEETAAAISDFLGKQA